MYIACGETIIDERYNNSFAQNFMQNFICLSSQLGLSVLAAEMHNKSCSTSIEIYAGELCHQVAVWHCQQLIG